MIGFISGLLIGIAICCLLAAEAVEQKEGGRG